MADCTMDWLGKLAFWRTPPPQEYSADGCFTLPETVEAAEKALTGQAARNGAPADSAATAEADGETAGGD
ncbi:MAG: hypothetical protein AAGD35_23615 [Actinomycetota bacterium]